MILTVGGLLSEDELKKIHEDLKTLSWRDGAETAGGVARTVKKNEQADLTSRNGVKLRERLEAKLQAHPVLLAYARPARWTRPLISRSRDSGGYGLHIDNSFMQSGRQRVRTDLSFTLFLSDPQSYEGGQLAIEVAGMTHRVKGEAGDVVIYPSTTLHQVTPVTSGERIVCVGWMQSRVRSAEQREMLFDLEVLKAELGKKLDPNCGEMLTLSKTMANLKRMWLE